MKKSNSTYNNENKEDFESRSLFYRLRGFLVLFQFIGSLILSLLGVWLIITSFTQGNYILCLFLNLILVYQYFFAKAWPEATNKINLRYSHQYFDKWEFISEEAIDEKKSLISLHPHGIFNLGLTFNNHCNYKCVPLASRALLMLPFMGMGLKWWDVQGVNKESFISLMKAEKNIGFIPGGFEEATLTSNKVSRIFIKHRKGFVKFALQYGYKIYPGFVFGESKMFTVLDGALKFRLLLNKFKIPAVIFFSKFGILPNPNSEIFTVIGKSIQLPLIKHPSKEDVNKYHQIYVESIKNIFYQNRSKYGYGDQELEIY